MTVILESFQMDDENWWDLDQSRTMEEPRSMWTTHGRYKGRYRSVETVTRRPAGLIGASEVMTALRSWADPRRPMAALRSWPDLRRPCTLQDAVAHYSTNPLHRTFHRSSFLVASRNSLHLLQYLIHATMYDMMYDAATD